jgi:Putative adhesin
VKIRSVAIVALTAVTASGCGIVHFADYRHTATPADAHVTGPVNTIEVNAGDGHVVVQTGGGDGVTVHRVVHYQSGHPDPGQRLADGTLTFSAGCRRCRVDYDLTVPASVRVRARTDNGRISVAGVTSADVASDSGSVTVRHVASGVTARDDSGSVHVEDVGGTLDMSADSGSLHATALRTASTKASSDSGSLNLAFTSAPANVHATSDSGSVHVTVPDGTYAVSVQTDSGGKHINVPVSSASPNKIYVHSDSGGVHVDRA